MAVRQSKLVNRESLKPVFELVSGSVDETRAFGEHLGRLLAPGDVVALFGELGSGKTTLVQGIAQSLGLRPERIKSPTFVLMREYPGDVTLVHLDGYRLEGPPAASWLDLEPVFAPSKITLIEWAERFEGLLPRDHLAIRLEHVSANRRRLSLLPQGERARAIAERAGAFKPPQHAQDVPRD